MNADYPILGIIAVITLGGGLFLLREAKRYQRRQNKSRRPLGTTSNDP